jgi:heat shock protein 5
MQNKLFFLFVLCFSTALTASKITCPVMGIDLGTTYSCVAVKRKSGIIEVIPNENGNRITPSVVAFTDDERLIGEAALNQRASNPKRTLYHTKRLLGIRFSDADFQNIKQYLSYDLINQNGIPFISTVIFGQRTLKRPQEISGMVLKKMKETYQHFFDVNHNTAVVTIPAGFNDDQRQATKQAALLAGIELVGMINEPTAVAVAYGYNQLGINFTIMVIDFGGGTLDVSVVKIDHEISIISTAGDMFLGGEDFTFLTAQYFVDSIKNEYNVDISQDKKAMQKLIKHVEQAKRILSTEFEVKISINDLIEKDHDYIKTLTRAKFEEINSVLFKGVSLPIKEALKGCGLTYSDISKVLLVGGSSRIPKVKEIVKDLFGQEPDQSLDPDEAVCIGAAAYAATLCGENSLVNDITPKAIGIKAVLNDGEYLELFAPIIPKFSKIPVKKTQMFTTHYDYQESVAIEVYEGDDRYFEDNTKLGEFSLEGIRRAPSQEPQIEVTMGIESDGILTVTATEIGPFGKREVLTLNVNRALLIPLDQLKDSNKASDEL